MRPLRENEDLWRSAAFAPLAARPEQDSRLGEFQRHYGDDVLELARSGGDAAGAATAWIEANPPRPGDAWHPYPLSTRIANWVAAATLDPAVGDVIGASLARQVAHLVPNVEDDVLGNHVIRNAKALVLAGAATGTKHWLERGRALLRRELPEQILPDGGHYERSPAYHRLVLRDLLEVRAFAPVDDEITRMTAFAAASSRPDGAPALFNDGGLDIAPRLELPAPPDGLAVFPETGYVFVRRPDLWLAFDCGPPSPPFLPAHAHADALSVQLWLDGKPVVVDPGTSTYEAGRERLRERGTAAHSTVAVDGDQFVVWGSFRSGPLPRVELLDANEGILRGRVHLRGRAVHTRTITISDHRVEIEDAIDGQGRHRIISALPGTGDAEPMGPLAAAVRERCVAERFNEVQAVRGLVCAGVVELPLVIGWRIPRRH